MAVTEGGVGILENSSLFVGRGPELNALARCRARAAAGEPGLALVLGEAGIGKTALARRALGPGPDGLAVHWARCDRSERDWPYGVVDQWLRRFPPDAKGLQDLIRLLPRGVPPLAVGADLLNVLASVAGPLALVVDDAQWADEQSLSVMGFVLRRLWSERLLVVATARTDPDDGGAGDGGGGPSWRSLSRGAARAETIRLTGLGAAEVGELARLQAGVALRGSGVERLVRRTGGHPLHLRTLLGQVSAEDLQDASRPLPVPVSLETAIGRQLTGLPMEARRLVEALAVLDARVPLAVAGRLAGLEDPTGALGPVVTAGLVSWDTDESTTPVRLHHALQRDAIYQAIAPTTRRELHAAAATEVSAEAAWAHRVAATVGTDTELAEELAEEAGRQAARGRANRAATLLLWAADLAGDRDGYEHHLVAAATDLCVGQAFGRARNLRGRLQQCSPSPRRDAVLGYLTALSGEDPETAERLLVRARATAVDPEHALLASTWLGMAHHMRADGGRAAEVLRPILDRLPAGHAAQQVRGMLAIAVSYTDGPEAGLAVLTGAGLPEEAADVPHSQSALLAWRGMMRVRAGRLASGTKDLTVFLARQRTDPEMPTLSIEHYMLSFAHYLTGRFKDASIAADQGLLAASLQGQPWAFAYCHAFAALAHASQGHLEQVQEHAEALHHHARRFPELTALYRILVEAASARARQDYDTALAVLRTVDDPASVAPGLRRAFVILWAPPLVEAATADRRAGRAADLDLAERAVAEYDLSAAATPALGPTSRWLHGRLAAAQGDTRQAAAEYLDALAVPMAEGDDIPLNRALCHHDFAKLLLDSGEAHHRDRAAEHLEEVLRICTELGAAPYAQAAADDLARLRPQRPGPLRAGPAADSASPLTGREQDIAHLAARGLTNREIARELFVSAKTVEYHLSHVYTKLGITNRRRLRTEFRPG